uniref:Uncharacterized protein n=1 Tax=Timema shepardi TaxID=629360 RepID=A0A7R9AZU8_TIMSH|nr:unnamed protein product [Timema shepardi]
MEENHPSKAETQPPPVISVQPSPPPDNNSTMVDSSGGRERAPSLDPTIMTSHPEITTQRDPQWKNSFR